MQFPLPCSDIIEEVKGLIYGLFVPLRFTASSNSIIHGISRRDLVTKSGVVGERSCHLGVKNNDARDAGDKYY